LLEGLQVKQRSSEAGKEKLLAVSNSSVVILTPYRTYQVVPEGTEFRGILRILLENPIKGWKLSEPRPLKGSTLGDL